MFYRGGSFPFWSSGLRQGKDMLLSSHSNGLVTFCSSLSYVVQACLGPAVRQPAVAQFLVQVWWKGTVYCSAIADLETLLLKEAGGERD